jgi:hypothetical protein
MPLEMGWKQINLIGNISLLEILIWNFGCHLIQSTCLKREIFMISLVTFGSIQLPLYIHSKTFKFIQFIKILPHLAMMKGMTWLKVEVSLVQAMKHFIMLDMHLEGIFINLQALDIFNQQFKSNMICTLKK